MELRCYECRSRATNSPEQASVLGREQAAAAEVENAGLSVPEVEVVQAAAEEEQPVLAGEQEGKRNRMRLGRRTAPAEEEGEANK